METVARDFDSAMKIAEETAKTLKMASLKMQVMIEVLKKEKALRISNGETEDKVNRRLMRQWAEFITLLKEYINT